MHTTGAKEEDTMDEDDGEEIMRNLCDYIFCYHCALDSPVHLHPLEGLLFVETPLEFISRRWGVVHFAGFPFAFKVHLLEKSVG